MSQNPSAISWNVARSGTRCAACQGELQPGQGCWAALVEHLPGMADAPPVAAPAAAKSASRKAEAAPAPSPYVRLEYCESCWSSGRRPEPPAEMFSFWKTAVPIPNAKKKLFVDDAVLVDLFTRLGERGEPQDVRFRFVLALILMRKRLLRYERTETLAAESAVGDQAPGGAPAGPPPEVWLMLPRGADREQGMVKVVNPQLTPEQITEVSVQLTQILAEEI